MRIIFFLILLFATVDTGAQESSFSLEESIQYGMLNSDRVKEHLIDIRKTKQSIREVISIGYPQVNGFIDYTHNVELPTSLIPGEFVQMPDVDFIETQFGAKNNFNVGANLEWLVADASYFLVVRGSNQYNVLSELEKQETEFNLKNEIIKSYLAVLIFDENIETLDKNITNVSKLYSDTKAIFESGFAEQLDVERLQLSKSNLETQLVNLKAQRGVVLNTLKFKMGYPISNEIDLKDDLSVLVNDARLITNDSLNQDNRIEVKLLDQLNYIRELEVQQKKSEYFPNLTANANYILNRQGTNLTDENSGWFPISSVGLKLNVPIFDGFRKSSQVQQLQLDLETLSVQRNSLINAIELEYINAKTAHSNALKLFKSQQKNLALAQKIYNVTQLKYKEGVGSSIEVTQAEQELYTTQSNYNSAVYELIVKKSELEKALGK